MRIGTPATTAARARPRTWIAAGLLAVAALLTPALATAASADAVNGGSVWIGSKVGYGGTGIFPVYETTPADTSNPGEPDYWAYCIEHNVSAKTHLEGSVGDLGSYLGANHFNDPAIQKKVLWVLGHSYPALSLAAFGQAAGVPGISKNDAIEAAQYAIWNLTDLWADPATNWNWETPDSEQAYHYLANGADAAGMNPGDFGGTVTITPPAGAQSADSLVGPFTVNTDNPPAQVTSDPAVALVDQNGSAVDPASVVDGQQLFLDLRGTTAAGSATVAASVPSSAGTGKVISVPKTPGATPTAADHAQTIILVAADTHRSTARAGVQWSATAPAAVPTIGTTLVDAADGDHVLPAGGGTVVDTVAYRNLTPGVRYTLSGELMRKSDGQATGIVGSVSFTPAQADGTVDVAFTVPAGYAGQSLVAFEYLHGPGGDVVAEHTDLDDAGQTVSVEKAKTGGTGDTPGKTPNTPRKTDEPDRDRLPETGGAAVPGGILIAAAASLLLGAGAIAAGRRVRRRP